MKESAFQRPIEETDRGHVTERIIRLSLEIIYLLTGEDYGPIKKPSDPPPPSLTAERKNDKKILEVTQKIIELLTGEVPIRCQDVTVYFSMEEWEYLEGHKDFYKDVMMKNRPPLTSPDLLPATETSEDVEAHMLENPNNDETLKLPEHGGSSHIVSDIASREEKRFVENGSSTSPGSIVCPATNIKEEPPEDDDVIITKILISTEQGARDCSFNKEQNKSVVREGRDLNKRHNGGLKSSKTHNGSSIHSVRVSKHQLTHTESQAFICSVCSKCFFTESDLSDHMESHFNAKTAYDVPYDPDSVLYSRLVQNQPFRCHYCGENFAGKLELTTHQLVHFKNPYTCAECGRNFLSKSGLVTHQKTHSKQFDCPTCGKSFLSKANLLLHQEVHLNSKPDVVPDTEVSFNGDSNIIVCQIDDLFSCTECGEFFDSKDSLLQHQQSHVSANSYVCPECGKVFNRKSSLSLHHKVIHQGNVLYACPDCGKGFSCHSELARHIRVHTGEQPYSCAECGKCFSFKSALVRHQRIHSGNRPYVCSVCRKGFSCNSALQRHQSVHLKDSFVLFVPS
ncbi:uncharacterized protein LOC143956270 [Lithobates pipiens]